MTINVYGKNGFKTSAWSGGKTTELFIYPPESEYAKRNFLFRLSSATVDLERSDFTVLTGIDRFIVPLNGNLKISHDGKYFTKLQPYEVYGFDGGANTVSEGKVRDFNLMLKSGTDGFVKSFFLSSSSILKFEVKPSELAWIFSYNNTGNINIECKNAETQKIVYTKKTELDELTLITFFPDTKSDIFASMEKNGSILYGKVELKK